MKKNLLLVLIILALVLILGISLWLAVNKPTTLKETSKQAIVAKIEGWSSYHEVTNADTKKFGNDTACGGAKGSEAFLGYTEKAVAGKVRALDLPYGITILYTLNYEKWSNKQFLSFTEEDMKICSVGWAAPLYADDNRVVWMDNRCRGAGCGGVEQQNQELAAYIKNYFATK